LLLTHQIRQTHLSLSKDKMQIFVRDIDGRTHTLDVELEFTLERLVNMITNLFGYTVEQMYIRFKGKCLWSFYEIEKTKTLTELGIENGSTIHPILRLLSCKDCAHDHSNTITIFAKGFDGRTQTVNISPTETIATLKKALCDKCGILDPSICTYTYGGKQFTYRNDETIREVGIPNEATVHICGRLLSCDACPGSESGSVAESDAGTCRSSSVVRDTVPEKNILQPILNRYQKFILFQKLVCLTELPYDIRREILALVLKNTL